MYCTSSKRNKTQKHIKASRSGFPDPSCQCGDIKVSSFYSFSVLSVPEHYTPYTSIYIMYNGWIRKGTCLYI